MNCILKGRTMELVEFWEGLKKADGIFGGGGHGTTT